MNILVELLKITFVILGVIGLAFLALTVFLWLLTKDVE